MAHPTWVCRLEHCSAAWYCSLNYTSVAYRQRASKYSFEAGDTEDQSTANYVHDQFTSFLLDEVWNDEHYIKLQVKGRYVNEVIQISSLRCGYLLS